MQQNKTASQRKNINPACWVPTAYFAMGLPFIAINLVSVFMFKDLGVSDTQIAFWTSLIMMPWTLKFLWSPFLEMFRTKKFFVLVTELLSGVLFGVVAFSLFFDYFFAISISTMAVIAFSGATHDIACDGVYMAELNKKDQAKYIGVQGAFYNVAKLVANGGLVAMAGALAEHFGAIEGASIDANKGAYSSAWMIIFAVIAVIMVLIGIYHIKVLPSTQIPSTTKKTTSEVGRELVGVIANFFTKKHILYYICFIILYRLAEGFIMKIAPLFLRASREAGGLGLSLKEIGTLNGIFGSAAFVLGSLLAGIYVSKFGLKKTLFTLCCIFNHRNMMCIADLHNPIHIRRKTIEVNRHNCLYIRIFFKRPLQCIRGHVPGLIITVDKDRDCFLIGNRIGSCRESQILTEHNIASFHSSCFQCQMQGCRTCG